LDLLLPVARFFRRSLLTRESPVLQVARFQLFIVARAFAQHNLLKVDQVISFKAALLEHHLLALVEQVNGFQDVQGDIAGSDYAQAGLFQLPPEPGYRPATPPLFFDWPQVREKEVTAGPQHPVGFAKEALNRVIPA
jgi:hypothetical protein